MKNNGKSKGRKIPEILTGLEQNQILNQFNTSTLSGLRNYAIIKVFLDCGLRAAELINLRHRDIDLSTGRLWVRQGKGRKDRGLWFNGTTGAALQAWFAIKPSSSSTRLPSSILLFTSLDGTKPLCGRWLRKLVTRLATQAGIDKRIHPHTLRHTFATNLLRQEKNLFTVMKALGHANLSTTQIYLHLEDEELEAAMKKLGNGG